MITGKYFSPNYYLVIRVSWLEKDYNDCKSSTERWTAGMRQQKACFATSTVHRWQTADTGHFVQALHYAYNYQPHLFSNFSSFFLAFTAQQSSLVTVASPPYFFTDFSGCKIKISTCPIFPQLEIIPSRASEVFQNRGRSKHYSDWKLWTMPKVPSKTSVSFYSSHFLL